ncbi:MAG: hypothetical protein LUC92_06070 [Clostridiales bacterium]|nr:hypothetical protein [Clostridiales bacterium]
MNGKELIEKLGFIRLEGLSEEKETDKNMLHLLNSLSPKEKRALEEIMNKCCEEQALREQLIYETGLKDGAELYSFLISK